MISMLPLISKRRRRHDVSSGVDPFASGHHFIQDLCVGLYVVVLPGDSAKPVLECLPGLDAIKEIEEESPEKYFVGRLFSPVQHVSDQVLTDPVGSAVGIREAMGGENWVVAPRPRSARDPTHEQVLP